MVLVWLLGLFPAAVATVLRGRLLIFFCGWLTAGILWFIGALVPDSDASERERRLSGIATAMMAVALVFLGLFGARPAPVLGLDGQVLQSSVDEPALFLDAPESCDREADEAWLCSRYDASLSGTIEYRVRTDGLGCWHGEPVTPAGEVVSRRISGCVTLLDFVIG